jgi:two-component system, chemotaxis family, CheB/CheR fusion protein
VRVVGVGASAGGLEAIRELFERVSQLPGGTDVAWIVVVHLDPSYASTLASHLQPSTSMPVVQVTQATTLSAGQVHVIPPGQGLFLKGETLHLEPLPERAHRAPIDRFFESLAREKGADAAAVVLSGMGSDGTKGALHVGRAGGLVLVQDPRDALFGGMPLSVVESGAASAEGTVAELAETLCRWARRDTAPDDDPKAIRAIIGAVLRETAHDFSDYRKSSLIRRIHHRMAAIPVRDVRDYAKRIDEDPDEARRLVQDLLIGVTRFFRDPEAFDALASSVIDPLLQEPDRMGGTLRVWVPGCATGEEAYSIAILCLERMSAMENPPALQVFGTDIDRTALDFARRGIYGRDVEQHVSRARLDRYFVEVDGGLSVSPAVQKTCLFSEHDLMRDPPFSKLDLVSCRNVLIYLGADAKERVLQIFHYALLPGGFLFLGQAEGIPRDMPLFKPVVASRNIHRKTGASPSVRPAVFGLTGPPLHRSFEKYAPRPVSEHARLVRQVERCLLEEVAPPAVAVDERHRVLFFVGQSKPFLGLPAGAPPTDDLFELAAKPLRHELAVAFRAAIEQKAEVRRTVSFHDADSTSIEIVVHPLRVPSGASQVYLVAFRGSTPTQLPSALAQGADTAILLEAELRETRSQLEAIVEDLEQSNDELKTSNEELQSLNEEFQSANEELQTSQEELQSMNEELRTLNQEFVQKVAELDRANADINNLFASTDIGSVFLLDRNLTIHRFTPHAKRLFRLLDTDRGRPIGDIAPRFEGCDVIEASRRVLSTLEDFEAKVFSPEDSRWYVVRIHPYRTLEGIVDGVVMTFIDVTLLQREISEREAVEKELRAVFDTEAAGNAEISLPSGRIIRANSTFVRLVGADKRELTGTRLTDFVEQNDRGVLERVLADLEDRGNPISQVELRFARGNEAATWVQFSAAPVDAAKPENRRAVVVIIDITVRHELEAKLVRARKVEALGRLAGGIAHDFNNLIAIALGHVEMMERGRIKQKDTGANLAVIRQVLDRATQLTRDLLAFGGRGKAAPRTLQLVGLLRDTERMLGRVISSDVALEVDVASDLWPVRADPANVEQMLMNLVLNARDALPRGGKVVISAVNESIDDARVAVLHGGEPGDYVHISVSDAGTGMDAATLARCLEPYFTTKTLGKGTGLGLASVAGTAEQAGGFLYIESEPGVGTTASIFLPRSLESEPVPTVAEARSEQKPIEGSETILLVEDEPMLLKLNREVLESYGFRVLTATNGAEALELARAQPGPIHLVVSDVRMPQVDGCELAERLPSVRPDVPVLLVSGHPGESRVPIGVPFMAKPFTPSQLVARMRELLDASRPRANEG